MMLTIVWDVDDVLNELMYEWFHFGWMIEHPDCKFVFSQLVRNPPHEVLKVRLEAYLDSMDRFRKSDHAMTMLPNRQILAWFQEHGHRFRHIALTARPLETAPDVAAWVMRHFGGWIRCFAVVPTRSASGTPVYDQNKGEFLAWIGKGDVLIDDADENIKYAAKLGLRSLQVAQPWNSSGYPIESLLQQLSDLAGDQN